MSRWILLRGLSRDRRHWGDFPASFSRAIPGAEVLSLDFPGNGVRNGETSPISVAALVDDCRQSLLARRIDPPVNLLAMSLGAMVAIDWASRYPEEISSAVLINTSLRRLNPFYRRMRPQNYPRLLGMALPAPNACWEKSVLAMTSTRRDPAIVRRWIALRHQHPVSAGNAIRQLLAAARYQPPAEAPRQELLLLGSTSDLLVDIECSRSIARHWSIPLIEHPTAGHDLPLDDAEWVVEQVRQWLMERREA